MSYLWNKGFRGDASVNQKHSSLVSPLVTPVQSHFKFNLCQFTISFRRFNKTRSFEGAYTRIGSKWMNEREQGLGMERVDLLPAYWAVNTGGRAEKTAGSSVIDRRLFLLLSLSPLSLSLSLSLSRLHPYSYPLSFPRSPILSFSLSLSLLSLVLPRIVHLHHAYTIRSLSPERRFRNIINSRTKPYDSSASLAAGNLIRSSSLAISSAAKWFIRPISISRAKCIPVNAATRENSERGEASKCFWHSLLATIISCQKYRNRLGEREFDVTLNHHETRGRNENTSIYISYYLFIHSFNRLRKRIALKI